MLRSIRVGLVAAAVASVVAPIAAAAAEAGPARDDGAGYCRRYDAYQLQPCGPHPQLPAGALGVQLGWVLHQLAGGADSMSVGEVRARLSADLLQLEPARQVLLGLRHTLAEQGPMRLVGYSYPPRADQVLALMLLRDSGAPSRWPCAVV